MNIIPKQEQDPNEYKYVGGCTSNLMIIIAILFFGWIVLSLIY